MQGRRGSCCCLAVSESESDTCGRFRDLDSSIGVCSGPGGAEGGRSELEALSWVAEVVEASVAGGGISLGDSRSGEGLRVCSISVEVVRASSGVAASDRGGKVKR